jgi:hypothetical protein
MLTFPGRADDGGVGFLPAEQLSQHGGGADVARVQDAVDSGEELGHLAIMDAVRVR